MTTAKRLFLRKEPGKQSLAEWWVSIVHDERFEMVQSLARAHVCELHWGDSKLVGANAMLDELQALPDIEEPFAEMPGPGLQHRMPEKQTATTEQKA